MLEYIKEHKFVLITVIYAMVSLYVLFSETSKSFEKYSLATNTLLLIGLFIMVAYQAVPSSNIYVAIIFITLIVSMILFFVFPMLSESFTLLFNLAIVGCVGYLAYKYIFKNINFNVGINLDMFDPISIAIFLSLISGGIIYWFYPKAERIMEGGGKLILDEPVHLNTLRSIANYNGDAYNYHYSVSFWTFLHSQPGRNKYTPIFNYGDKPRVEYNAKTQKIRIRVADATIYEGVFVPQRWTNFVITYDRGVVDVFIDAKLVATEKGVVPYMTYDNITIGENNGVSGGIGYVKYYDSPMKKTTIDYNYRKFNRKTFF